MKEPFFTIDERIETLCRQAEEQCAGIFRQISTIPPTTMPGRYWLPLSRTGSVSPMFAGTTGYGYGDIGREALDAVLADIFGCEDALDPPTISYPAPMPSPQRCLAYCGPGTPSCPSPDAPMIP